MKHAISTTGRKISLMLTALLASFIGFAQEKKVDVDIDTDGGDDNFFMRPWVWVVGGAVFLLLLVALLRNNSNK